jgi:hypothetical protein
MMPVRPARYALALALLLGLLSPTSMGIAQEPPPPPPPPQAVVALIDTGINPYSAAFRDPSPLAYQHPSTYIPGYPADAQALPITLDVPYEEAIKQDEALWDGVRSRRLYWIPGTRIIGAISYGGGGTNCPAASEIPPANALQAGCLDTPILDDHGHGSMTASRAAGSPRSLAPGARIVAIEGLGANQVRWAANAGWIDVQSNSWIDLVPPPVNGLNSNGTSRAFAYAAERMLTLAASGNGTAYIMGGAPTPTYALSTAAPGVVLVGGHDNGRMTLWSGSPPHVVADAYAGFTAIRGSTEEMRPDPIACCSSAASPYAAGGAAAIILEARRILGDPKTGTRTGVVAEGPAGLVPSGPLADGVFTLAELKDVFFHTAEARPGEGVDDGRVHWAGDPRAPEITPYGVGSNPFCQGCTTTPVRWQMLPQSTEPYPFVGYGGINERSVALAFDVLAGRSAVPARPSADTQYQADQDLRKRIFQ